MVVMVKEKCGRCGTTLIGWVPNYYAIGEPYVRCSNCKAFNDLSSKATEWAIMPSDRKSAMVALTVFWGFAYSIVVLVIIGGLIIQLDPSIGDSTIEFGGGFFAIFGLSLIIGIGGNLFWLKNEIRKSNARLTDGDYRSKLKALNLISE